MKDFSFVFQINTGSFTNRHYTEEELSASISRLFSYLHADKVILGWYPDTAMYREATKQVHSHNAEAYLWLPVFADIMPSLKTELETELGIKGVSVATQTASSDEHFEFIPPEAGINHVLKEYKTIAQNVQFDGVFLDRIRYGIPSENQERSKAITKAAEELTSLFHTKSLKVGLDLFAPHLAPYMGQDSRELGKTADFIKPMMYWATNAPAGIPYEEKVFRKTLKKPIENKDSYLQELASECDVFPGIEVNYVPGICNPTPAYVLEKISYFKQCKCKGAVLSWNSPDASDEMLKAISQLD